jgi:hypothetical protein
LLRLVTKGERDLGVYGHRELITIGEPMKILLIFARALGFVIPLARTALAAPDVTAAPTKTTRLPFKGTLHSNESYRTIFPTMFVTATESGEATLLGRSPFITRLK